MADQELTAQELINKVMASGPLDEVEANRRADISLYNTLYVEWSKLVMMLREDNHYHPETLQVTATEALKLEVLGIEIGKSLGMDFGKES